MIWILYVTYVVVNLVQCGHTVETNDGDTEHTGVIRTVEEVHVNNKSVIDNVTDLYGKDREISSTVVVKTDKTNLQKENNEIKDMTKTRIKHKYNPSKSKPALKSLLVGSERLPSNKRVELVVDAMTTDKKTTHKYDWTNFINTRAYRKYLKRRFGNLSQSTQRSLGLIDPTEPTAVVNAPTVTHPPKPEAQKLVDLEENNLGELRVLALTSSEQPVLGSTTKELESTPREQPVPAVTPQMDHIEPLPVAARQVSNDYEAQAPAANQGDGTADYQSSSYTDYQYQEQVNTDTYGYAADYDKEISTSEKQSSDNDQAYSVEEQIYSDYDNLGSTSNQQISPPEYENYDYATPTDIPDYIDSGVQDVHVKTIESTDSIGDKSMDFTTDSHRSGVTEQREFEHTTMPVSDSDTEGDKAEGDVKVTEDDSVSAGSSTSGSNIIDNNEQIISEGNSVETPDEDTSTRSQKQQDHTTVGSVQAEKTQTSAQQQSQRPVRFSAFSPYRDIRKGLVSVINMRGRVSLGGGLRSFRPIPLEQVENEITEISTNEDIGQVKDRETFESMESAANQEAANHEQSDKQPEEKNKSAEKEEEHSTEDHSAGIETVESPEHGDGDDATKMDSDYTASTDYVYNGNSGDTDSAYQYGDNNYQYYSSYSDEGVSNEKVANESESANYYVDYESNTDTNTATNNYNYESYDSEAVGSEVDYSFNSAGDDEDLVASNTETTDTGKSNEEDEGHDATESKEESDTDYRNTESSDSNYYYNYYDNNYNDYQVDSTSVQPATPPPPTRTPPSLKPATDASATTLLITDVSSGFEYESELEANHYEDNFPLNVVVRTVGEDGVESGNIVDASAEKVSDNDASVRSRKTDSHYEYFENNDNNSDNPETERTTGGYDFTILSTLLKEPRSNVIKQQDRNHRSSKTTGHVRQEATGTGIRGRQSSRERSVQGRRVGSEGDIRSNRDSDRNIKKNEFDY